MCGCRDCFPIKVVVFVLGDTVDWFGSSCSNRLISKVLHVSPTKSAFQVLHIPKGLVSIYHLGWVGRI